MIRALIFILFFPEIEREIMPTEAMTTQTYLYEEYHTQPTFNTDTDSQNKHTINNRYCSINHN